MENTPSLERFLTLWKHLGIKKEALQEPPSDLIPVPWINPLALDFLSGLVCSRTRVLEIGSGGSTLWFGERCRQVISYESDKEWMMLTADEADKRGMRNVDVYLYDEEELPDIKPNDYDIVFVDGPKHIRSLCIHAALPLLKSNGWMILDNAHTSLYGGVMNRMEKSCIASARFGYTWDTGAITYTHFWRIE